MKIAQVSAMLALTAGVVMSGVVGTSSVWGQSTPNPGEGRFVDHVYRDADGEHKYVVFEPAGYTPDKKWPLVFYLHGASGRGRDGRAQLVVGLGPAVKARAATLPFLVVFPQNENLRSRLLGGWNDESTELDRALKILEEVERTYPVDRKHEVLIGVSMGAFGAWQVAAESPERWKAVIPISGGGEPEWVPALAKVPVWAFHAADDQLVPPSRSTGLVADINAAGGRAYASVLPRGGHNIGAAVLARDEVFAWIQNPDSVPTQNIDWSRRAQMADMTDEVPFVPGAQVHGAAHLRVHRDILESLSYVIAERWPAEALQGWKPATRQTQRAGISTFDVTVGGMHYNGRLETAWITPQANNTLRVQLGLRNLTMTITGTRLQSRLISASAGPMAIYIGYREPVWLNVDIQPQVVDHKLQLRATNVQFEIPHHNWSISRPGVSVRPLPFLDDRIADSLVEGVAAKKTMIEQEFRNSVPQMLAQLEQRVAQMTERTITYRQWPMPLWQPRFRFYPESVAVTENGIDLKLGAYVAALAPKSRDIPLRQFHATPTAVSETKDGLDASISLSLIDAYSTLLSASDVARFHVLDLNGEGFRKLGRHEFWNSVLPADRQLAPTTQLNTEFVLAKPFQLRVLPNTSLPPEAAHRDRLALHLPQLQIQLATREPGEKEWKDYARADIAFDQRLQLGLQKIGHAGRRLDLQIEPIDRPEVHSWLVGDDRMLDNERIAEQFQEGWSANFGQTERDGRLPDLKMGNFSMRWEDLDVSEGGFFVHLIRPDIRIYNETDQAVEYEVRGQATPWSDTLRLEPHDFHEFRPATALTWRSRTPQGEQVFTLPLGFEARYQNGTLTGIRSLPAPSNEGAAVVAP